MTRAILVAATAALAVLGAPSARAGTPEVTYFLGDVNCDQGVDSIDAALLLQREAALLEELSCGGNADMDGDGSENSVDAGLALQYTAGLTLSRVQFSLNVTRPEGLCDDAEKPSLCNVPAGTEFGLSIALNHPPPEGYIAFQVQLSVDDLMYNPTTYPDEEVTWPESGLPVRTELYLGVVAHGGLSSSGPPFRVSTYRGDLVRLSLACPQQPRSYEIDLFSVDPATTPLGSAISLPNDAVATTIVVGTGALPQDDDGDGVADRDVLADVAARLQINCVE